MDTVLLAGGGTGGHIYPNVGVAERLEAGTADTHFLVSDRPGDVRIAAELECRATAIPVRPLPRRPWEVPAFVGAWRRSVAQTAELIDGEGITAVIATGGFVSGPAIVAARRARIPTALVNLDAVPGIANRYLVRFVDDVFTTYPSPHLSSARRIGLPLREASASLSTPQRAREELGLEPGLRTLFVTGATHGGASLIAAIEALVRLPAAADLFTTWQILHQCGGHDPAPLQAMYDEAGVRAEVVPHLARIGTAWAAADLAIARSGAGTVGEAWASSTPTVFVPNPHHPDQRDGRNAGPLVDAGGAVVVRDRDEPRMTAAVLLDVLAKLLANGDQRERMRAALTRSRPTAGTEVLMEWVQDHLGSAARGRAAGAPQVVPDVVAQDVGTARSRPATTNPALQPGARPVDGGAMTSMS